MNVPALCDKVPAYANIASTEHVVQSGDILDLQLVIMKFKITCLVIRPPVQ